MQKNSQDFSIEEATRLAESPVGQQLIAMLRGADPQQLQQIADQVGAGDYAQASKIARQLLSSPDAQELLKRLGR